ncbi:MAG: hypothetical protein JSS78_09725 [Bacteroidetes bacterium]|nr:hypothetical protein [Bacteroidota bacterium]
MHLRNYFTSFLLMLMGGSAWGQQNNLKNNGSSNPVTMLHPQVQKIKKPKPISQEWTLGGGVNTDGWHAQFNRGKVKPVDEKLSDRFYSIKFWQVEIGEYKHPKEIKGKSIGPTQTNDKAKPYVYGKINNFYDLKLGYGFRKMIAGKPEQGDISVHWLYAGGLSIGLLKPYYIDAYVLRDNPRRIVRDNIKYSDEYSESFTDQSKIVGSSGWTTGLGETKVIPGLYAKTAVQFDFAASTHSKLALEIGVNAELYSKKIALMVDQPAYPYFLNAYVALTFGRRK